jgi:hypothetical protein
MSDAALHGRRQIVPLAAARRLPPAIMPIKMPRQVKHYGRLVELR